MQSWWMQMTDAETVLDLRDAPVPAPAPAQLLVRMHAAGLNRGEFVLGHGLHGKAGTWKAIGGEGAGAVVAVGAEAGGQTGGPRGVRLDIPLCIRSADFAPAVMEATGRRGAELVVNPVGGLAERSFKRRFQRATGMSPLEYVHTLRLEEAKQILETSNASVEAIANEVGYEDAGFFSRLFPATGEPKRPPKYRKRFGSMRRALAKGE